MLDPDELLVFVELPVHTIGATGPHARSVGHDLRLARHGDEKIDVHATLPSEELMLALEHRRLRGGCHLRLVETELRYGRLTLVERV